jgi:enoyl reductase-like protein
VLHDCDLDDLSNRVIEIAEFEPCVSSSDLKTREFTLTERGQEILSVERPARVPELEVPTAVKNLALRRVLDRTAEAEGLDEAERLDWIDRTFREELEQLVERLESRRSELFSIESAS